MQPDFGAGFAVKTGEMWPSGPQAPHRLCGRKSGESGGPGQVGQGKSLGRAVPLG